MFLNAIDREFPGIIREVEAMEVGRETGRRIGRAARSEDEKMIFDQTEARLSRK